jgi:two-component system, NarL family, response regulator
MATENRRCITVLAADDHAILRRGLADIINHEADMRVVAEACDGPEAVKRYKEYRPDVALIDLAMPGIGGVEVIRAIKASHPEARLIILTTYDTEEDIELGFRAGAQAYLLKDVASEELVECIRDVMRGRKRVAPAIAEKLAAIVSRVQLTGRELRILRLIAEGKANREIADTLQISDATVKAHITNLLSKLQVSSRTEAIAVAIKRGLVRVL